MRIAEKPKTNVILPAENHGHEGKEYVVERSGDYRSEDVAAGYPGQKDGQDRFQTE